MARGTFKNPFKLRKRIKVAPGVTINLSKSGVSATIGGKGASINIGKKGTFLNAGIPGTGIYSRSKLSSGEEIDMTTSETQDSNIQPKPKKTHKCCKYTLYFVIAFFVLAFLAAINEQDNNIIPTENAVTKDEIINKTKVSEAENITTKKDEVNEQLSKELPILGGFKWLTTFDDFKKSKIKYTVIDSDKYNSIVEVSAKLVPVELENITKYYLMFNNKLGLIEVKAMSNEEYTKSSRSYKVDDLVIKYKKIIGSKYHSIYKKSDIEHYDYSVNGIEIGVNQFVRKSDNGRGNYCSLGIVYTYPYKMELEKQIIEETKKGL